MLSGLISVFLQAAGVLLILWTLVGGLLLRGEDGGSVIFLCRPGKTGRTETFLGTLLWLRETGLIRMPVVLLDTGLSEEERGQLGRMVRNRAYIRIYTAGEFARLLEKETEYAQRDGADSGHGTGDCLSK